MKRLISSLTSNSLLCTVLSLVLMIAACLVSWSVGYVAAAGATMMEIVLPAAVVSSVLVAVLVTATLVAVAMWVVSVVGLVYGVLSFPGWLMARRESPRG